MVFLFGTPLIAEQDIIPLNPASAKHEQLPVGWSGAT